MAQPILVRGLVFNPEDPKEAGIVQDSGYSFCNCKNIFFTDWYNIDVRIYDSTYHDKYQGEFIDNLFRYATTTYFPRLREYTNVRRFCDIGAINKTVLDEAAKQRWKTFLVDINPNSESEQHETIIGNIEDESITEKLKDMDVIWFSHVIEHLKDPLKALKNLHGCLAEGGLIFMAMPDPYFIDWNCVYKWGHWWIREHHILWDMVSLIKEMEALGFECLFHQRNYTLNNYICSNDCHMIFRKLPITSIAL